MMKPAASSRAISSPTTLLFSSDRRRRGCLTGFASDWTCNLCSANSVGTPGMSLGDHAKMSRFSRRKSTSSPSYLLSRFAPMTAYLSGYSGSKGIFFVSFGRLERTLSFRLLRFGRHPRPLVGHRHNLIKEPLLSSDHQGLG